MIKIGSIKYLIILMILINPITGKTADLFVCDPPYKIEEKIELVGLNLERFCNLPNNTEQSRYWGRKISELSCLSISDILLQIHLGKMQEGYTRINEELKTTKLFIEEGYTVRFRSINLNNRIASIMIGFMRDEKDIIDNRINEILDEMETEFFTEYGQCIPKGLIEFLINYN